MGARGARLGIDFGTSNTVAVLELPGREPRAILFDGSPLLPSAVCADPSGRLLVGRDALHTSLASPASFEPFPKRCIDDETVLLGEQQVPVPDLIAAALRRVAAEAALVSPDPIVEVVLTCPAAWGAQRRGILIEAAAQALPAVRLVTEPVAAASFFVEVAGSQLPVGRYALVYDFGAGTFDASVVQRTEDGFVTVAAEGLPDAGGLDIDAAIVDRIGATVGVRDPEIWQRLLRPETTSDRRASRQLWDNVRAAKEMLSRGTTTLVHVPLFDAEAPLGREELEEIAAPVLARTVKAVRSVLDRAGIETGQVAAVFLAGGSSRMPAVATVLHRALGVQPTIVDQPELAVAEGSLRTVESAGVAEAATATPASATEDPAPGSGTDEPAPVSAARSRRHLAAVAGSALVLTLVVAGVVAGARAIGDDRKDPLATPTTAGASPTASPTPTPSPTRSFAPQMDPCLLGTWRSTSMQTFSRINGDQVQLSGGAGIILTYKPDATASLDYNKSEDAAATHDGARWTQRIRGTITMSVRHTGGKEYISNVKASGTNTLYRAGKRSNSIALSLLLEPDDYFCTENRLEFHSTGVAVSVWARVNE
ncbi:Hsp70 family protein [Micromonospora sp. NPDC049523]|uniref:Hsp70 family protein n=1 Tax=Micromonospora sp. NPDC049523 TaxID=3155921 RepID=UPI00341BCBFD